MIGKPYPIKRRCFQCGHLHETNLDCEQARLLRAARWIFDIGVTICGAVVILGALRLWEALCTYGR